MELPQASALPRMAPVRQLLPGATLEDLAGDIRRGLRALNVSEAIGGGKRVAITAGSRGAGGTLEALKAIAAEVREAGGQPFVIPAMGSHGGATAEGQRGILSSFGITEQSLGMPIDARMDTVILGRASNGYEAHYARSASEADAVIVLGRATVHPNLRAGEESDGIASGLLKMVMIGLGKQPGAYSAHHWGLAQSLLSVPNIQLRQANIVCGVSIVENGYRQPHHVDVVPPAEFKASDQRQVRLARSLLPGIPFNELDVLVCQQMGKDVAGSGLDTNVIGFWRAEGGPKVPNFRRIVSLDLTDASGGNAIGIGLNDVVTRRLVNKVDRHVTYMNQLTGANREGSLIEAFMPVVGETDREAIEMALGSVMPLDQPRLCCIHDTSRLAEMMVSEALLPLARQLPALEIAGEPRDLAFDAQGRMIWMDAEAPAEAREVARRA